ncbi:MAG: DNA translocase FtsK, partial [Bacilli bacterium]|nr:DNA translocase FtsK [Bacilli bacterium]
SLGNVDKADRDNKAAAEERRSKINDLFLDYNVGARIDEYKIGRSFTTYLLRIGLRTPIREISKIEKEIALSLGGIPIRFSEIDPIYRKPTLEIVNPIIKEFSFKECLLQLPDVSNHPLAVPFGLDSQDKLLWDDMNACPHILIAGTSGSGKSIFIHALLSSLIYRLPPSLLRLVILNPNKTEFYQYTDLPHLLTPVANEISSFGTILNSLLRIMEERYLSFEEKGVPQLRDYNEIMRDLGKEPLPYILVVIDEYQLYARENKEISRSILLLVQKARAAGIHILLSSQSCSPDVLLGSLIINMPTKVAFQTSSPVDSYVALGHYGAESLLGRGDMLLSSKTVPGSAPVRLQGAYISRNDMKVIFDEVKSTYPLQYDETLLFQSEKVEEVNVPQVSSSEKEDLYPTVEEWVKSLEYVSLAKIQRKFSVGFNRAGKLFSLLERNGIIEPSNEPAKGYRVIKK